MSKSESNSVEILFKHAKDKTLDLNERRDFLLNAYLVNKNSLNNLIKCKYLREIAFEAYKLKDSLLFIKSNTEAQQLSLSLEDTLGLGDTYWNFGLYYARKEVLDSAYYNYYKAFKSFEVVKHNLYAGRMLLNIAVIQNDAKDYTGSEISTFQAIERFDKSKNFEDLYRCYNNLGVLFKKLKEYDKAVDYHQKAQRFLRSLENKGTFVEGNLNNIGLIYQDLGKYDQAIQKYKRALMNKSLVENNKNLYAKIIDNLAYSQFKMGDTTNVKSRFYESLRIRDSLNYSSGIIMSKLHLAEYYLNLGDSIKAVSFAKDASELSSQVDNYRDKLVSLKMLSELDRTNSDTYLNSYITLNDSLQALDRAIRNKFTRIRYETDEYVQETERLATQNILISIIGTISVFLISLLYFLKRQSSKNKVLLFEKDQQKANEEIYELMLQQQHKLEQGRLEERHRISEDLHDGVLGKLFGTRVGLGFLDLKGEKKQLEKHQFYINEMQGIEKEIRDISHELKNEALTSTSDFAAIISDYIKPLSELHLFTYSVKSTNDISWDTIDEKIKVSMYRIIQEAVQNVVKHAQASSIFINFYLIEETLHLSIADDGVGFDIKRHKKGIGHKNMKSRVVKLNGSISINTKTKEGTTITITFPKQNI